MNAAELKAYADGLECAGRAVKRMSDESPNNKELLACHNLITQMVQHWREGVHYRDKVGDGLEAALATMTQSQIGQIGMVLYQASLLTAEEFSRFSRAITNASASSSGDRAFPEGSRPIEATTSNETATVMPESDV